MLPLGVDSLFELARTSSNRQLEADSMKERVSERPPRREKNNSFSKIMSSVLDEAYTDERFSCPFAGPKGQREIM